MNTARANIAAALETATTPAVMCSFGKESLLLLALVREVNKDIPLLWFREGANEQELALGRKLIKQWNLRVYGYWPRQVYLIAEGDDFSLVQEYAYGDGIIPMLARVEPSDRCVLTAYPNRTEEMWPNFDLLLMGYKDCDQHWVKGDTPMFPVNFHWGHAKVVAPLRHMTDDAVRAALLELNIPYAPPTGELALCTACLTAKDDRVWCPAEHAYIPRYQWDQEQSLSIFRQRFRLGAH